MGSFEAPVSVSLVAPVLSSSVALVPSSFVLFSAGAMVALVETEEEEDDDVPLMRR